MFQRFSRSRKVISEFLELARQRFAIQVDFRSLPVHVFFIYEIAVVNDVKHRLLYTEMNKFKRDKSLAFAVLTPIRWKTHKKRMNKAPTNNISPIQLLDFFDLMDCTEANSIFIDGFALVHKYMI